MAAFDYDCVIVGSGPAGTSTALHLAAFAPRIAARTVMLDLAEHPRHKLCGGGCVRDVDICLKNLGLDICDVPHADADWAHLHFLGHGSRMRLSDIAFHVVRRHEFDAWLADRAQHRGVKLESRTRVLGFRQLDGGVEVQTNQGTLTTRSLVGADGTNSVVKKWVEKNTKNGAPKRGSSNIARVVEVLTPVDPAAGTCPLPHRDAVFEFQWNARKLQGYAWCFPTQDHGAPMRNWGIYDCRALNRESAGSLKPILAEWMQGNGFRLEDFHLEGHPVRWFDPRHEFASPNTILVGDAAGVDAVFGEGISPALGYGELAARAIEDAFARSDFSFASYRRRVLNSPLGRNLRRRTTTAKLVFRLQSSWSQRLVWHRLNSLVIWYLKRYVFNWAREWPVPIQPSISVRPQLAGPHAPFGRETGVHETAEKELVERAR